MDDVKHEDKMHEMHDKMGPHMGGMHMMHKMHSWQKSWKSPVSLGIFFLTTALAIAVLLYTILNVIGAVAEAMHPADSGLSAQDMQRSSHPAQQIPFRA